jgi:hypothetical protein
MRGQSLAYSVAGTLLSCSPQPPLAGCGSVRQSSSALLPVRSFRLGTAFCSPAATDLFREPPRRGQCSRPIPSSEFGTLLPARSAISSHPGSAFFTPPGMLIANGPLPAREPQTLKLPSDFHFPSGLSSLQIAALSRRLGLRSLPLYPARFSFAPRRRQLF